ncbi:MAG: 50S ribosomal protein L4 [Pseudomonadota bacterium]|nr:50S ribosomal protein L4 [Pseudomonadota bacterium]
MKIKIEKSGKKQPGTMSVADSVFAVEFNEPLVHQVLVSYMSGSRSGTKSQKSRSEVRGGGRKPWRQKGTGRARAGTIRSPLWRGGGVTFAAKSRDYSKKVNRKMFHGAMRSIFSELLRQERFVCVDEFDVAESKTKLVKEKLNKLGLKEVLIITEGLSENLYLGVRNIPKVDVMDTNEINPYSLIGFEKILITQASVEKVEEWLT